MSGPGGPPRAEAWLAAERAVLAIAAQTFRRALRRRWLVLLLALLATTAVVTLRAVKAPTFEATIYFRVDEGEVDDGGQVPAPPQNIREHIANVALSSRRIESIMRKHDRSVAWLAKNREAAIDDFLSDISINVTRDYFIWGRNPSDPPRSAHVAISMRGPDADESRTIIREIGDAVLEAQAEQRNRNLAAARQLLQTQLAGAQAQARSLQGSVARLRLEAARGDERRAIAALSQIAALKARGRTALENVLQLESRIADIEFRSAAEESQLGMIFAPFDDSLVTLTPRLTKGQLARRAALVFLAALLVIATLVGTFDDRLYEPRDAAAHGLPCFGALPRFPGDEAGALRTRTPHLAG